MALVDKMTAHQNPKAMRLDRRAAANDESVIDVQRYIDIFFRRPFLIGGAFIGLMIISLALTQGRPKEYTAMAQIQANMHQRNAADLMAEEVPGDSALADASKLDTEVGILQSRVVAVGVLKSLGPAPAKAKGGLGIGTAIKGLIAQLPLPRQSATSDEALDAAVSALQKELKVEREGTSYIIDVSYTDKDPAWAAKVANTFVAQYLAQKGAASIQRTEQANAWLNNTLDDMGKQVVAADAAVAQYRAEHNLEKTGSSTMNEETVSAIDQQLVGARAEEAQALARYTTAKQQLAAGSNGEDVGEALASPVIQSLRAQRAQLSQSLTELRARYGPKNPEIQKTADQLNNVDVEIQTEVQRIISNLAAQAQVARQRVASLQASLDRAGGVLASNEHASVKLDELLRDQDAARTTYQGYLSRYKQSTAQQDLPQIEARVLAFAVPPDLPSAPKLPKSLAISFAISVVGALAVMFGAEALQQGFNDPDEVARVLDVPVLVSIPVLSSTLRRGSHPSPPMQYVMDKPLSMFAESFRTLRTSLMSMRVDDGLAKVIAITSAVPHEGKTTTSVCLGRVAARGDAKTVIIDCDMRRRSLDQILDREAEIGLLDVLDGKATLAAALRPDTISGAYLLPLGRSEAAHRDMFSLPTMDALLNDLRAHFDLVLLDAPPVLALADARIIAQKADLTLLLACWRRTPKAAVQAAMLELEAVGATLAGVALTQVDLRRERKPRYGGYYYDRSYENYFGN